MFSAVRRLGRGVVLVLLTWTAIDVLNPGLCVLDTLPTAVADTSVSHQTAPSDGPASGEDCFCCSHNVNFSPVVQVAVSLLSNAETPATAVQNLFWTSFPLYHPPRLLS